MRIVIGKPDPEDGYVPPPRSSVRDWSRNYVERFPNGVMQLVVQCDNGYYTMTRALAERIVADMVQLYPDLL